MGMQDQIRRRGSGGLRVPSVVMVFLGAGVGWLVANGLGAVFGAVIGFLLWRSRR